MGNIPVISNNIGIGMIMGLDLTWSNHNLTIIFLGMFLGVLTIKEIYIYVFELLNFLGLFLFLPTYGDASIIQGCHHDGYGC